MMKSIGLTLLFVGAGSAILYFFDYNLMILSWINHWGETVGWGIRGALVFVGSGMVFLEWLAGDGDGDVYSGHLESRYSDTPDSGRGPADIGGGPLG